jgi:hypothetical protein
MLPRWHAIRDGDVIKKIQVDIKEGRRGSVDTRLESTPKVL